MLVKRVLNTEKKNNIEGLVFHLIFLDGNDAVLYDKLWDAPIIYGPKTLVRTAITNPVRLLSLLPKNTTEITLFVYVVQSDGELKRKGEMIKGDPTQITVPNY